MTTTLLPQDQTAREQALVAWADQLGAAVSDHAVTHDRDGTFVSEAYDLLRSSGYLALAVPEELGGRGATIREVAMAQRALARHCASTALASVMHHHVVLFTAWRHRRGLPGAEATLRRVADDGIVLVSTGGADLTRPRGQAVKVDGGYLVSGHKIFASQSPVGDVMSTMFPYEDPDEGRIVLNMAVPMAADGVTVLDTWDALGMRGTGSHDVEIQDVFVPEDKVIARRPFGKLDPPLQVILMHAIPPITAVYLGVAESARDHAVAAVAGTAKADDPTMQRQVGLMDTRLRVAAWALDGALAAVGNDPAPSMETVAAVQTAKREVSLAALEVCDLALEVGGGASFYKTSPIERAYRDVRGIKYHPFTPEESLLHAGQVALGLPADDR
ncbi:MAG TPA: acyl-CoA dehydrogenase family protein [Acidimicrobiales bacterium]|nr:acyl-CoA dehydrogenase family protein [Acidimicrobiales bacterium]